MPVKSSRFSRMAYARRAALLAEDLAEWAAIYRTQLTWNEWVDGRVMPSDVRAKRVAALEAIAGELRDVSSELAVLR